MSIFDNLKNEITLEKRPKEELLDMMNVFLISNKITKEEYKLLQNLRDDLITTIATAITNKLSELSQACEQTIIEGIDVETTIGSEHFSLEYTDQLEINNKYNQIKEGAESVLYHSDGNSYRQFDANEMKLISDSADKHIQYHRTYFNILKSYVTSLTSVSEINSVTYGATLPSEFESKLIILNEQ